MIESKMAVDMCLYCSMASEGDNISIVERTEVKNVKNGLLTVIWHPTKHSADIPIL